MTKQRTPVESSCIRAAMYARVSSDQQAQQGTIESQIEDIQRRVQTDGLTLEPELCFIDDGHTGSTLIRPALERLRDMAWAGGFQRLYVHSPDRLARKYAWQVLLVDELRRGGVEIVFLNRSIGASPEEDLLLQMQGMIAEYERTKIMERSRRGKRQAAQRGLVNVLVKAPYGYRYIGKHEGGGQAQYQVDFEQAKVVRKIFEWVALERMSSHQVARRLAREGIVSAKGSRWCAVTVLKLLRNRAYTGQAVYGKTRTGEYRPRLRPGRGRPAQPRRAETRYPGRPEDQFVIPVPAIVSQELFDAAAAQVEENRKRSRHDEGNQTYLLAGLLECDCCGYAYSARGGRRFALQSAAGVKGIYPYYRCSGTDPRRFDGQPICSNKPVRLDRLDAVVWADVRAVLENPADLKREFERRLHGETEPDVNLVQINKQIASAQRSISRLIDAYESGLLEKTEFEPRIQHTRQRIERLEKEASAASDYAARQAELRLVLNHMDQFARQVRQGLDQADIITRREIVRSLVKVIKIEPEHVRITYRVSPRPFAEGRSRGQIQRHCHHRVRPDHP